MRKDVLLAVAKATREIPDSQFDMECWKSTKWVEGEDSCGTIFCAIGNAIEKGLIPGLVWSLGDSGVPLIAEAKPEDDSGWNGSDLGFTAIARVLGITPGEAIELFSAASYSYGYRHVTREEVAERVEKFVNQGEGESDA